MRIFQYTLPLILLLKPVIWFRQSLGGGWWWWRWYTYGFRKKDGDLFSFEFVHIIMYFIMIVDHSLKSVVVGAQLRYYVLCNSLPAWQADSAKFLQVRSLTCDFTTGCGLNNNTGGLVASTTANSVSPVTRTDFVFLLEDFKFISPLCRVVYCMNFC